jgi:hypothetical protein
MSSLTHQFAIKSRSKIMGVSEWCHCPKHNSALSHHFAVSPLTLAPAVHPATVNFQGPVLKTVGVRPQKSAPIKVSVNSTI